MSKHEKPAYNQLKDSQLRWPHKMAQWLVIKITKLLLLCFGEFRVRGKEYQPKGYHSYIVASNHVSMKDPLIVAASLDFQPLAYMAKIELFRHPAAIAFFYATSAFAVNREKLELATVKSALKVLKDGRWCLGLFPEGTRNQSGDGVKEAKRGVAYFSKAAGVPVMPVGLAIKGEKKNKVAVYLGELIPPEDDLDALSEKVRLAMQELAEAAAREFPD